MTPRGGRLGTWYRQYLLPGVIFQSVLIGGGYASGREVVEFGGKFGAWGIWAILVMFLGFSLMSMMAYEIARVFRVYDYKNWIRQLIFGLWPIFDLLYVAMLILTLGVLSAATGSIAQEILGWPYWMGAGLVLVLVAVLNFYGKELIAGFKTVGTAFLYFGYLIFAGVVIFFGWDSIGAALAAGDTSFVPGLTLGTVLWTGLLYVGYNLAGLPATLFFLEEQKDRRHTVWAGVATGLLSTLPFTLTWLCLLSFYPGSGILEAPVPWIRMLTAAAGPGILLLYGLVVVWTLVETCTGMIHAAIGRVDAALVGVGRSHLTRLQSAFIAAGVLILAGGLSRFGIIDLISKGYTAMAYGFLLFMALPLLTVGIYRILKRDKRALRGA